MNIFENNIQNKKIFINEFLINLKEPLQFISIMFAIVKYLINKRKGKNICINNPILFDASCNGLQHLSALTRELKIIRSFIKKTVMTIPYNISLFGVQEQMKEHLSVYKEGNKKFYKVPAEFTKNNEIIYLYPSEVNKLAFIIFNGLIDNLPSLKLLNKYLDQLLSILLKLNCPIFWITPVGLKINLSTIKFKKIRSTSSLIPFGKPVTISIPTNKLNTRKIKTSFMPNLVHSLDASNIHILCEKLNNQPLYTIHDCFASTANNMYDIEKKVKASFIEIYFNNENYLEKMHMNLIDQIKSINNEIININENEYIIINNKNYIIPKLPEAFTNKDIMDTFIQGIKRSKFFIS